MFKREDGFFVGATMANVVTTEFVVLAVSLVYMLTVNDRYQLMLTLLFVAALWPLERSQKGE